MAMLYYDSLSRMYGPPGCGKSFIALDMALSKAAGIDWCGKRIKKSTTLYVMAEGQAVNADRMEAWLSYHDLDVEDLADRFIAVPDAISLTEPGVRQVVEWCAEHKPEIVVLDTKNAMMLGEENSATEFAVMRRALDMIRKSCGCCVLLIDHTGYEGTRARGTSAGTAAMDTEIRVTLDEETRIVTATVTRDKAAESGFTRAWRLTPESPAAVLEPIEVPGSTKDGPPDWSQQTLPDEIDVIKGGVAFREAVQLLAKLMRYETDPKRDLEGLGISFTDAYKAVKGYGVSDATARRGWRELIGNKFLESALSSPSKVQMRTGPMSWKDPD